MSCCVFFSSANMPVGRCVLISINDDGAVLSLFLKKKIKKTHLHVPEAAEDTQVGGIPVVRQV